MAGNISDAEEIRLLDLSINSTYMALFTVAPTDAGGGTEVTGGSYARQAPSWASAAAGAKALSADLLFPTATANWGTIVAIGLFDAASGGTMRWWGPLTSSVAINQYDRLVIQVADLSITLG